MEKIIKREPTFRISCDGKSVTAWRTKGGYILKYEGFEIGKVAPRDEMPSNPYLDGRSKKDICDEFVNTLLY